MELSNSRTVQRTVLEFADLCDDPQTSPAGNMQWPKLPVLGIWKTVVQGNYYLLLENVMKKQTQIQKKSITVIKLGLVIPSGQMEQRIPFFRVWTIIINWYFVKVRTFWHRHFCTVEIFAGEPFDPTEISTSLWCQVLTSLPRC